MARVLKESHSFTCTPHIICKRNEPYLPWVAGWLHTK